MNPLGLLVIALGVVIIIVGVKGSQHNLVAALTNKQQAGQTTKATTAPTGVPPAPSLIDNTAVSGNLTSPGK